MSGDEPTYPKIEGLPWPLNKALVDTPFAYLIMLRNGVVIECAGARQDSDEASGWITLINAEIIHPQINGKQSFNFERGMCVRIEEIVLAVDAPHGS